MNFKKMGFKKRFIELAIFIAVLVTLLLLLGYRIANFLNNKGVDYCNLGQIDKAISLFEKSLQIWPDAEVHCNLANAYLEQGMLKESSAEYKKALRLNDTYARAYFGLAYNYEQAGRYQQALSCLEKTRSLGVPKAKEQLEQMRDNYILCLFNQAADFYSNGEKNQAELKFKEVIEIEPNFTLAYKMLGDIKFSQNLFKEAIVNYKKALELGLSGTNIYNLYNDIGISYMRLENYSESIKYFREAYRFAPSNVNILYNLASTLRDNKNFREALAKYKKLARLKSDYLNVHNDLAGIYKQMGKIEQAEKEFKKEIEVAKAKLSNDSGNIYYLNSLALAYNGLGQYERAKKIINDVIKIRPNYGEAYYTRAKIYENLGDFKEAMDDLEKAKVFFPRTAFIDNYIFKLETKRVKPKSRAQFSEDIAVYLANGRQIKGKLKEMTDERVSLEVMVGDSFGTIALERQDVVSLERLK